MTIPVYALTEKGTQHVLAYLDKLEGKLVAFRINSLPRMPEGKEPKLMDSSRHQKP